MSEQDENRRLLSENLDSWQICVLNCNVQPQPLGEARH